MLRPTYSSAIRRLGHCALSLLPLVAGCAAQQGVIAGRVVLAPVTRPAMALPPGVARDPRAAVVYLETIPEALARRLRMTPGPDAVVIDQGSGGFSPAVAAVAVGGTIVYRNHDRVFHQAFARADADSFDTGQYRPGETRSVSVREAARFPVFCAIHPGELGVVIVTPTRVLAQPGRDGRFRLPALPFGHYELHAWHPAYGEIRRQVELRDARGARIELGF